MWGNVVWYMSTDVSREIPVSIVKVDRVYNHEAHWDTDSHEQKQSLPQSYISQTLLHTKNHIRSTNYAVNSNSALLGLYYLYFTVKLNTSASENRRISAMRVTRRCLQRVLSSRIWRRDTFAVTRCLNLLPCNLLNGYRIFYPDDGGSEFLRNASKNVPDYMVSHKKTLQFSTPLGVHSTMRETRKQNYLH
jgi:hypothetical protein